MIRLKRLSRFMVVCCNAVAVSSAASLIYVAIYWLVDAEAVPMLIERASANIENPIKSFGIRLAIISINAVTLALILYGLFALSRLFSRFQHGELFTFNAAAAVSSAGKAFLAAAIYSILANTLTVILLTWSNSPGQRQLAIGINSNMIMTIIFAGTLFAVGHALKIAASIEEENKGFV